MSLQIIIHSLLHFSPPFPVAETPFPVAETPFPVAETPNPSA